MTKAQASAVVDAVFSAISDSLARDESVAIPGFGRSRRRRAGPARAAIRALAKASPSPPRSRLRSRPADPSRRGARVARHRTSPRRRRGGTHRPSPLGDPIPPGGRGRGDSPRRIRAMSSSSLSMCRSPVSANAALDAQAALSSSRFAMSRGGGSSSSPSISADWHMNSSHSVLMHENVDRISVARHSMPSSAAGAIGGATASRGMVGIAVMGGCSRGCAAGFARRSWRPDAGNIRPPHFTVRVLGKGVEVRVAPGVLAYSPERTPPRFRARQVRGREPRALACATTPRIGARRR